MTSFLKAKEYAAWHLKGFEHSDPSVVWYKVENGQWMFASKDFKDVRDVDRPYKRYTCQELVDLRVEPKYQRES
jgi:hypothetical protein